MKSSAATFHQDYAITTAASARMMILHDTASHQFIPNFKNTVGISKTGNFAEDIRAGSYFILLDLCCSVLRPFLLNDLGRMVLLELVDLLRKFIIPRGDDRRNRRLPDRKRKKQGYTRKRPFGKGGGPERVRRIGRLRLSDSNASQDKDGTKWYPP